MAEIDITDSTLTIRLKGMAKLIARMNRLRFEIPLAHVIEAAVHRKVLNESEEHELPGPEPFEEPKITVSPDGSIEWKLGEKKWKKNIWEWHTQGQAGGFEIEDGQSAFLDGAKPQNAIWIALTDERFALLLLGVAEPVATVARINAAVRKYKSS